MKLEETIKIAKTFLKEQRHIGRQEPTHYVLEKRFDIDVSDEVVENKLAKSILCTNIQEAVNIIIGVNPRLDKTALENDIKNKMQNKLMSENNELYLILLKN